MRLDWHLPAIARIFPILHDHPAAQSYIGLAAAITGAVFLDFALELFIDLFLLPMVIWDLASRGRGGLALIAAQPLRMMLGATPAWLAFAGWAVSLLPR